MIVRAALAVLFVLGCAASSAFAREDAALLRASFDSGADGFIAGDAPARVEGGALVADDAKLRLSRPPWLGDLAVRARALPAPRAEFALAIGSAVVRVARPGEGDEVAVSVTAEGADLAKSVARLDADGAVAIDVRFRSAALLVRANGAVAFGGAAPRPLSGGPLSIEAAGRVRVDSVEVDRLEWRETVQVEGADDAKIRALMGRPSEDFSLDSSAEPSPLDPVYEIRVRGEDAPIRVVTCGPRETGEPAASLSPLDQALALARVKPWTHVRVLAGPQDGKKEPKDGALAGDVITLAPGETGVLEISALVGITGEWPTITVLDVTERERILDRTVPCGAVGRSTWAEVDEQTSKLKVVFHLPGLADLESTYTVRRAPQ